MQFINLIVQSYVYLFSSQSFGNIFQTMQAFPNLYVFQDTSKTKRICGLIVTNKILIEFYDLLFPSEFYTILEKKKYVLVKKFISKLILFKGFKEIVPFDNMKYQKSLIRLGLHQTNQKRDLYELKCKYTGHFLFLSKSLV